MNRRNRRSGLLLAGMCGALVVACGPRPQDIATPLRGVPLDLTAPTTTSTTTSTTTTVP